MEIDQKRVNATGGRIVRGLCFRELGKSVPPDKQVKVACDFGISPSHPLVPQFARVYQLCPNHRDHSMDNVFSYIAGIATSNPASRTKFRMSPPLARTFSHAGDTLRGTWLCYSLALACAFCLGRARRGSDH